MDTYKDIGTVITCIGVLMYSLDAYISGGRKRTTFTISSLNPKQTITTSLLKDGDEDLITDDDLLRLGDGDLISGTISDAEIIQTHESLMRTNERRKSSGQSLP
eukprot:UN19737